ncbi:MAG: ATP-binding protein [Magnetococcus sp. YQC-5]
MLHDITFKNFKSYQEASLPLASLTMLIGANASGKSNAIEGLRLLSWLAQGNRLSSIQSAVQESNRLMRGRIQDLGYHSSPRFSFSCSGMSQTTQQRINIDLEIKKEGSLRIVGEVLDCFMSESFLSLYQVTQSAAGMGTDLLVEYNNFILDETLPTIICCDQYAIFTQLDSPAKFASYHKTSQEVILSATAHFRTWLSNILFLDLVPAKMRDYSFKNEKQLQGDGKNLSSVLFDLWGGNKKVKLTLDEKNNRKSILNFIGSLPEQDIDTIDFLSGPRGEVMVQIQETFGREMRKYDASLLSDGTLRVMAIAAAMLSCPEGGMVVIEEIDNGVHPSRAALLMEQIALLAARRSLRVLLSSHNPALLDALPDSAIPHVVFCYRDPENGSSRLIQLQNIPDYPELIAQGSVGRLMTSGILERFVKHYSGTEDKKQKALDWLARLQKETTNLI